MTLSLTSRDLDLLDALTLRVRLLTLRQVTELWWPSGDNQRCARRRLEWLSAAKLVEIHRVNAHPLLPVTSPLFAWQPGETEPDCELLAESCRERWNRPAVPMNAQHWRNAYGNKTKTGTRNPSGTHPSGDLGQSNRKR